MQTCPACREEVSAGAVECPSCGVILAKYRPRAERARSTASHSASAHFAGASRSARSSASGSSPLGRLLTVLLLGIAGGAAVAGGYWYLEIRPRVARIDDPQSVARPSRGKTVRARIDTVADYDRELQLPGGPRGAADANGTLLVGNRVDPWGFMRVTPLGDDRFSVEKVPVVEREYAQRVSFSAVAWNGEHFVGYTDGSWFRRQEDAVFTLHDATDLRVLRTFAAPSGLGCLEWDGAGYWAATRRNTRDADEPAYLYRIGRDFEVELRHEAPAVGCQGLAWDGRYLWLADVFSDSLIVMEIRGGRPTVVHSQPTRFEYLSGLAFFDGHLWVSEYDDDRLHRLNPRFRTAWTSSAEANRGSLLQNRAAVATPRLDSQEVERLRRGLRSIDPRTRDSAESTLQSAGLPIDYDREIDPFAPQQVGAEEVSIDEIAVELAGGVLYGSWRLRFGEGLFESERRSDLLGVAKLPLFARFTVDVGGGSLGQPLERTWEAQPGENRAERQLLAEGLGPGEYRVFLFVHVQFVDETGQARILNQSSSTLEVSQ